MRARKPARGDEAQQLFDNLSFPDLLHRVADRYIPRRGWVRSGSGTASLNNTMSRAWLTSRNHTRGETLVGTKS